MPGCTIYLYHIIPVQSKNVVHIKTLGIRGSKGLLVEHTGLEPVTPTLPV